jgi:hypothetical protein
MIPVSAEFLNEHCYCSTLNRADLQFPQFFSPYPHFISEHDVAQIQRFVKTYEHLLGQPEAIAAFRAVTENIPRLSGAASALSGECTERGVFNSYDFHMSAAGPQLIEINSNAAGAALGLFAASKIKPCCEEMAGATAGTPYAFSADSLVTMFREEFKSRFPDRELKTVGIVDDTPETQYFYPEFQLVAALLRDRSIEAHIISPEMLSIRENGAFTGDIQLDFIYNRLTDFYLDAPAHAALREIYERGLASVSPNPAVHALYANKANLAAVWSPTMVDIPGVDLIRKHVPETVIVTPENRDRLWESRKQWFFKPVASYGGKGVFRGDKLTHKTWEEIEDASYIAQRFIAPRMRHVSENTQFKYDVRVYTYRAKILGIMARYYQGQTTNFRTTDGGLATVMITN